MGFNQTYTFWVECNDSNNMDVRLELTTIYYHIICKIKEYEALLCIHIDIFEWVGNIMGRNFYTLVM